ncbi:sce7726 family protein [Xenorhabdus szentirmaii]|uniref:Sce7726 family protein n=1 Tax=Xenorhabdus szentirmaii TaxID=290112 RepID=A0AAW3YVJ6_9GAMM|nr:MULTISPECIES: sce7726 family protein [unclassified Xenorhabdus]MBD2782601.1 sce7726 family protein [Xenorhabdus sp. 38]MBD2800203.1 sce7726 family protein [Xenorhabdus sp. M]MBD2803690.1 sce7726 family protein [Xenorhabdus sp. ZM]MBD2826717.1 sce7726 family protein [Xenorhabdus sp. 5]
MKDIDVRRAVHSKILKEHHKDPDTLIIDEFTMSLGASRADIAVINGLMHGYEIKSKSDNLLRLPSQTQYYSSVMDKVTLVVSKTHVKQAMDIIPDWWGVKIVTQGARNGIHLHTERHNRLNPSIDKVSLSMLLWKEEMLEILSVLGKDRGLKSKPRRMLWNKLAEALDTDELRDLVREKLKARTNWRAEKLP